MAQDSRQHIVAFFTAFALEERRSRWLHLFEKDLGKLSRNANKLLDDLNPECIKEDKHLNSLVDKNITGVFYDIHAQNISIANLSELLAKQPHFDGIFSIEAGKKAVYFFHEGQRYVLSV